MGRGGIGVRGAAWETRVSFLLIALAALGGCGGASTPAAEPSPDVRAAIQEGVQHVWDCEDAVHISTPEPLVRDMCTDGVTVPHPDGDPQPPSRAGAASCRHWEEEVIEAPVGEWRVEACGRTENFVCLHGCVQAPLVCLPSADAAAIEVQCGGRR